MNSLFKNCLFVDEVDGWYVPSRFTEYQLEYYGRYDATLKRSTATSTVALRFTTSSKKLSFDYKIVCKARDWAVADVFFGGEVYSSLALESDEGTAELSLPGDPSREITVYLPHLVAIRIKNLKADAPLFPVADREKRWLALGDSITQGMVAHSPAAIYPSRVAEALGCEVLNAGVGGIEFNADELDYIGYEPDLITVSLGTNDFGTPCDEMRTRVCAYFDKLLSLYKCEKIYAITPIWRSDELCDKEGISFATHREVIAEVVSRYPRVEIIDGYTLVPHDVSCFGDPAERQVHPTEKGFAHYSENLLNIIKNI